MYWVSVISTPLILILAFWVVGRSLQEVGGLDGLLAVEPSAAMAIPVAVTTVVGTFISAGTQARTGPGSRAPGTRPSGPV